MKFDPRIGLAIILTLFLQTASGLLWAGHAAERLEQVERSLAASADMSERLARLEVQLADARSSLERIERNLESLRGRR